MYFRSLMNYQQSTKMFRFYRRYDDIYVCVVFDVERNCFQEFKEGVWCPQPRQTSPRAPDVYIPILRKFLSWSIFVCSRRCSCLRDVQYSVFTNHFFQSRQAFLSKQHTGERTVPDERIPECPGHPQTDR